MHVKWIEPGRLARIYRIGLGTRYSFHLLCHIQACPNELLH
uniref:Uncharacterized protein n=1 Tax=Rhizophora mucronata TaxID=61149 RepID=A0A2P2QBM8_RHIMU